MNTTYVFPPIHESILDNGLRVLLVPDTEQDGLVVAAQFRLGTFSDPVGLEGTAELCMGLIQKGSGELSAEQTAEKLEFAGASLFSDVGEEHLGLGIRMLCQKEEEILPVFWNMLLNPRFEQHEFTRIQREMVTSLQAETVDPGIIANRYFYRTL
ncbi:MAG: insulinase family protein, partial [Fibrobacter sp.]|nr:insulinase family protein [Fibrobacter sp.]